MAFADESVYFGNGGDASIIGRFYEKDFGRLFEFSENRERGHEFSKGYPHKIWVTTPKIGLDQGWRYGKVLKTVAYIVVDENDDGTPKVEKWQLKQNSRVEY